MSFFKNPDFFTIQQLDLENKLIAPTSQLFAQVSAQLKTLYQTVSDTLIDTHRFLAVSGKQVYEQPTETLTAWYATANDTRLELVTLFKNDVMPKASVHYQQVVADVTHISGKVQVLAQDFFAHPKQSADALLQHAVSYLTAMTAQTKTVIANGYDALLDLSSLLVAQPIATVQALYKNALSTVLELYFDMISSLLISL